MEGMRSEDRNASTRSISPRVSRLRGLSAAAPASVRSQRAVRLSRVLPRGNAISPCLHIQRILIPCFARFNYQVMWSRIHSGAILPFISLFNFQTMLSSLHW